MTKQFPAIKSKNGVIVTYKVIANFRDKKISIYIKYNNAPFTKIFISNYRITIKDINNIMFEFDEKELFKFILEENHTGGKIKSN